MLNSVAHTESRTEPFIWTPRIDRSYTVNHNQVKVLRYSVYFLLVLPGVGNEPSASSTYAKNYTRYFIKMTFFETKDIRLSFVIYQNFCDEAG